MEGSHGPVAAQSAAAHAMRRPRVGQRTMTRLRLTLIFVVLCALGAVVLTPVAWMASTSLKPDNQIFTSPPTWIPNPVLWNIYPAALQNFDFINSLKNTLIVTVSSVVGIVLTSAPVAYSLSRLHWRGRDVLFAVVLATLMVPNWVTAIPLFIVFKQVGWIGTFWPLIAPNWTGDAFSIFLLRQFFLRLPQEMFDAAGIDGAGYVRQFLQIVLPLAKPALGVVALFAFMNNWTDFINPLIYLQDPSMNTLMLGLSSFFANHTTYWSQLMAASIVILAPLVVLFFLTQRLFIEGVTFTGLAGS